MSHESRKRRSKGAPKAQNAQEWDRKEGGPVLTPLPVGETLQSSLEDLPEGFKMTEIGPLPEEWQVVRLGEVASIQMGQSPPSETYNLEGFGLPFLQGKAEFTETYPRPIKWCSRPQRISPPGSILISVRAPVGDVNIADRDYCIGRGLAAICLNNTSDVWFVFYYLRLAKALLEEQGGGTTFKSINRSVLENFPIPLPPLPEQRAIAHVLRTVQRAKEATERVIAALKELKKSLMRHLFTYGPVAIDQADQVPLKETEVGLIPAHWQVVRLGEVTEKTTQVDPRRSPSSRFKYVDVSAISNEHLRIESYVEYLGQEAPHRARKVIKTGDIIFATIRPYLKRIAMVPESLDGQIASTAFCVIRCNREVADPLFVFHVVSTDNFVDRVAENQRGSSYPAVTDKDVLGQPIPLPPLAEQQEIARILQAVDRKIKAEEGRKRALEGLFKSLLHHLMTGKVRVKDIATAAMEVVG